MPNYRYIVIDFIKPKCISAQLEVDDIETTGALLFMDDPQNFANYLKTKRQAAGLSQNEVSVKLGYSGPQFISNLERGISQLPIYKIPMFAELYGVQVQEFIDEVIKEHARILRIKIDVALDTNK